MSHRQSGLGKYPSWVPALETGYSTHRDALSLAVVLVVGLAVITPVLTLTIGLPALALVALTGAVYGALAILLRRVLLGLYVAFTVTLTFAANVPLASDTYLNSFAGHLGPELWLMQLPLAGVVCCLVWRTITDETHEHDLSLPEQLFGGFVVWAGLSAVLGAVVRVDAALYFVVFLAQGLIAFIAVRHAVQTDLLPFRTIVEVFALAVAAHAAIAIVQFFNEGILGIGSLGELARKPIATLILGPLGEFTIGTYVAGFTAMSFLLAVLVITAIPIALALALRTSGWQRWGFAAVAVIGIAVVRVTGTDAGRGALLVALGAFGVAVGVIYRRGVLDIAPARRGRIQTSLFSLFAVAIGVLAFLYPSDDTGSKSNIVDLTTDTGGTPVNSGAPEAETIDAVEEMLGGLQIPFFDISTLGIRFQQYVAGIDLFIQYPLFGIGGANFRYYALDYGLREPMPIHNIYISVLAQTGLPGFLLFVSTLVLIVWTGWRAVTGTTDPTTRLLLVAVLAGLSGFLAFQFFGYSMLSKINTMFSFWVLAGAVVGVARKQ